MGRSYKTELNSIPDTLKWACKVDLNGRILALAKKIRERSLLIVGSGGSFSVATFIAKIHEKVTNQIAKPLTPFEFLSSDIQGKNYAVLLITSSGNNKDILDSLKLSISRNYADIYVFCLSSKGKLIKELNKYPSIKKFVFENNLGKDGFLSVNSLLSSIIIFSRLYVEFTDVDWLETMLNTWKNEVKKEKNETCIANSSFLAMGGGWGTPVLVDLESKFVEAALGNISISDVRNFGHGRHNWIDKKGDSTSIIYLINPETKIITEKIKDFLPRKTKSIILSTPIDGPLGTIELFLKLFLLVGKLGKNIGIDPGRPSIPDYGRKIYKLGVITSRNKEILGSSRVENCLRYKSGCSKNIENNLRNFIALISRSCFQGIVFDWDGTLVNSEEKYAPPSENIKNNLYKLLSSGVYVGIASGRGKSLQENLKSIFSRRYFQNIVIGNYNGSLILDMESEIPNNIKIPIKSISMASDILYSSGLNSCANIEVRRKQITITPKKGHRIDYVIRLINEYLGSFKQIKIFKSDHSIDVLDNSVSKTMVVTAILNRSGSKNLNVLRIGDQGQYGGNDFELLNHPFGISVDKVSMNRSFCWNISPPGYSNAEATEYILQHINIYKNNSFTLDLNSFLL